MMHYVRPFGQLQGQNTVNTAVTGTSANVAIPAPTIGVRSVRIVNAGTQNIFVKFGTANTVAAVAADDMPMLANTCEVFLLPNNITHIAAIAAGAGSTMYVTVGEGT